MQPDLTPKQVAGLIQQHTGLTPRRLATQIRKLQAETQCPVTRRLIMLSMLPRQQCSNVWHPADKHQNWINWGPEFLIQRYAVYLSYVKNARAKQANISKQVA